jgi:hypothetical protein
MTVNHKGHDEPVERTIVTNPADRDASVGRWSYGASRERQDS